MSSTVTSKGQVTIPKAIRQAVGIKPGDTVDISATASGGIYIERPRHTTRLSSEAVRSGQAPPHSRWHYRRRDHGNDQRRSTKSTPPQEVNNRAASIADAVRGEPNAPIGR